MRYGCIEMAKGWSAEWKGDNFKKFLDNPEKEFLMKCGYYVEGEAKRIVPVDTGNLRSSIHTVWNPLEKAVYVGTNVKYGEYVEFGTWASREPTPFNFSRRGMKPRPYLRPSLDKFRAKVGLL